ncbi:hypothetical protein [Pseudomonas sp. LP_7_YM]|uniref:hypothetical protein n=1 Tax=Pseudomonas sp. LP_7_YM TaxID=2485137 RepID=UPI00105D0F9F|nr:hypothetical protein [Pseudomonas sp. LP_7_YM]TDV63297.1 hypothetical protein EC915_10656 [Pseudomonas sp. LP_7_YM]
MVGIATAFSGSSSITTAATANIQSAATVRTERTEKTDPQASAEPAVSTLARQLSEAAKRAELRDATIDFKALGQLAGRITDELIGDTYQANKARNNAEVPDTDDPELLARARQATGFIYGNDTNPFKGLSGDQLAVIAYDEGGEFTVNERRAAWREAYDQEQVWRRQVIQKASAEYEATGKTTSFFAEVLDHYESLPAIERAQYPQSYVAGLRQKIGQDFTPADGQARGGASSVSSENGASSGSTTSGGLGSVG